MEKAFRNWREGAIHLNFPNGNQISTTWAAIGSYSDNHDLQTDYSKPRVGDRIDPVVESNTVEVMITCGEKLQKRLEKKFNDGYAQPLGYLTMEDWLYVVDKVSKEKTLSNK